VTAADIAILPVHCPDRQGLVAAITSAIHRWHGNVVDLDQHVDAERGVFFMRFEHVPVTAATKPQAERQVLVYDNRTVVFD
jgi:formyltetrahydrofolate hydrolase